MRIFFVMLLLMIGCCQGASDVYSFPNAKAQQRFESLTGELRCLVCQNQTIAESNAGLANDLRNEVYNQIRKGASDKEIVDYLVARYGNFILYRPPFDVSTLLLWLGPLLFLSLGLAYFIYYLHTMRRTEEC